MKSKLSKSELEEYVRLSRKKKQKLLGLRLTNEEYSRYEALAEKHGRPLSTMLRETLFGNLYHFKGIKQEKK